jgi:hypothetical protein
MSDEQKLYCVVWQDKITGEESESVPDTLERCNERASSLSRIIPMRNFYVKPILSEEERLLLNNLESSYLKP